MNSEVNRPERHILWWLYSIYPVLVFLWGTYILIIKGNQFHAFSCLSIMFDALGIFCLYCFLKQKPSFSRGFWGLFVVFYILKLVVAVAVLISISARIPWDGSGENHFLLVNLASIVFGIPFLVAIVRYAFGSREIWNVSRGAASQG
jgi:hypothetical protein